MHKGKIIFTELESTSTSAKDVDEVNYVKLHGYPGRNNKGWVKKSIRAFDHIEDLRDSGVDLFLDFDAAGKLCGIEIIYDD